VAGLKIRKGDRVRVLTGKDRGKEGTVLRAMPSEGKLIVEGVNTAKKHQKPTRVNQSGGIVERDMPIPVANVAVLSPGDGRPTRVGFKVQQDGTKVRVCKRTGAEL
jgi:large subunit ribosomal protein L24